MNAFKRRMEQWYAWTKALMAVGVSMDEADKLWLYARHRRPPR